MNYHVDFFDCKIIDCQSIDDPFYKFSNYTNVYTVRFSYKIRTMKNKISRLEFLKAAGIGAAAVVITGGAARVFTGCASATTTATSTTTTSSYLLPGEASEYLGTKLTAIVHQDTSNAIYGPQTVDQETYRLTINGLVDNPLSLSYSDLTALPQVTKLARLNCVEGWSYLAKWTGPALGTLFAQAKVRPSAVIAIFYTADDDSGFTSLDLNYIQSVNIIITLKDNDVTLKADSGFPARVVAEDKYGYKWAKWVTRVELSDHTNFRGYWESAGYNNVAAAGGPAF